VAGFSESNVAADWPGSCIQVVAIALTVIRARAPCRPPWQK
jgi:hypothetical protein